MTAGTAPSTTPAADVIWAGPGIEERDAVHTGQPGQPNSDEVHGGHVEVTWHGSATGAGVLDGGADSMLRLQPETWGMGINTNLGILAAARWPANQSFSGFTDFVGAVPPRPDPLRVRRRRARREPLLRRAAEDDALPGLHGQR